MQKITVLFISAFLTTMLFSCGNPNDGHQDDIVGTWYTKGRKATVEVYKEEGKYYGKITDLKRPLTREGKKKLDFRNPDPKKKNSPLMGTRLLLDLEYDGDKVWDEGRYYDYNRGKLYDCEVSVTADSNLRINLESKEKDLTWKNEPQYLR
ncbi:MAG: DUF2147 domain-containing protein [Bacteroidales bacterium]|nr:DUF2147 domain-containing protein [Bacteroidales bacterium]MCF8332964.1 DUF2147 domain-containing protein [Bacteroidales bacterium]